MEQTISTSAALTVITNYIYLTLRATESLCRANKVEPECDEEQQARLSIHPQLHPLVTNENTVLCQ